jgi:NAD(P)-dependent dehydrogenase (short-subunit alcohol dehydrogenase family)
MSSSDHTPEAQGAICLVTGAIRGLGRAVAEEMARRGATVEVTGRHAAAVRKTVEDISAVGRAWAPPAPLDVDVRGDVDAAAAPVGDRFGTLDILINNAAAFVDWSESASTGDLGRSRDVMETNLYGPLVPTDDRDPLTPPVSLTGARFRQPAGTISRRRQVVRTSPTNCYQTATKGRRLRGTGHKVLVRQSPRSESNRRPDAYKFPAPRPRVSAHVISDGMTRAFAPHQTPANR